LSVKEAGARPIQFDLSVNIITAFEQTLTIRLFVPLDQISGIDLLKRRFKHAQRKIPLISNDKSHVVTHEEPSDCLKQVSCRTFESTGRGAYRQPSNQTI